MSLCQICGLEKVRTRPTLYAFYLPQFHRIRENDAWWGRGFTEWTNVASARPLFDGHSQPKVAGALGFYDLTNVNSILEQGALAQEHGLDAFCVYFYWFGTKRLLEKPLELMSQIPGALPFFICWANENWSRTWDGNPFVYLQRQDYPEDFVNQVFEQWLPLFQSNNYLVRNGKVPLVLYKPEDIPNLESAIGRWKILARNHGIHLEVLGMDRGNSQEWFSYVDGVIQFPPAAVRAWAPAARPAGLVKGFSGQFYDYLKAAAHAVDLASKVNSTWYIPGAMPAWDNSPRKGLQSQIFLNSSELAFRDWLLAAASIRSAKSGDEPVVFINAWNEWAEGAFLEPEHNAGSDGLRAVFMAKNSCETCREGSVRKLASLLQSPAPKPTFLVRCQSWLIRILPPKLTYFLASARNAMLRWL